MVCFFSIHLPNHQIQRKEGSPTGPFLGGLQGFPVPKALCGCWGERDISSGPALEVPGVGDTPRSLTAEEALGERRAEEESVWGHRTEQPQPPYTEME